LDEEDVMNGLGWPGPLRSSPGDLYFTATLGTEAFYTHYFGLLGTHSADERYPCPSMGLAGVVWGSPQ
jgi:hypothetical protein